MDLTFVKKITELRIKAKTGLKHLKSKSVSKYKLMNRAD